MKVGVDARDLAVSITGLGRHIFDLLVNMAPLDRNVKYILYTHKPIYNFPFIQHENIINRVTTGPGGVFASPREVWKQFWLPFAAKREKIDVLFIPSNTIPLFLPCPSLLMVHDVIYARYPKWGTFKEKIIAWLAVHFAHRADIVITPSKNTRNDLVELGKCPQEKIVVITHGSSFDFSSVPKRPSEVPENCEPFLLFVGFDYPRRNIPGLIRAFGEAMKKNRKKHNLILAGGTNRRELLLEEIERADMKGRVLLLEHIADDTIKYLYMHAEAFVYPSIYEGLGLPVSEALSAGLPVVVPNTRTMPEIVGEAGVYFNPNEPQALKNAILKVINNHDLREELSEKGKARANLFSWDKVATETLALLKKLGKRTI